MEAKTVLDLMIVTQYLLTYSLTYSLTYLLTYLLTQGVEAKTILDLMIVTQYFDMMKDIGAQPKSNAVFLNHSPGALEDLAGAVSKGFMSGLPAAPGFAQPMGR